VSLYPNDVITLVAHEPPLPAVLPDREHAQRAMARYREAYASKGFGTGMATFVATAMWRGEFTEDFLTQPLPDPAQFGMPTGDDGGRDDPLLSERSNAVTEYRPDIDALKSAPARIVIAVGEESAGVFTGRASEALATLLGQRPTVFPSHHGGFVGGDSPHAGKPEAFAEKLREVLAQGN
jgi:hypothetical protein